MKTILHLLPLTLTLALVSLPTGSVHANASSSPLYTVVTDTLDGGGQTVASASYRANASLGAIGGAVLPTPRNQAGVGFGSQLTELQGLVVSSPTNSVPEGGSITFSVLGIYDDGTVADLAGIGTRWSVRSGPLTVIGPNGAAVAATVHQNAAATVQAACLGQSASRTVTVRNVNGDNFGSYAGDGVGDAWQVANFGLNSPAARGDADPDGDGHDNRAEWNTGTDPHDPSSRFTFEIAAVPGHPDWKALTFRPRLPGRTYFIEYRNQLSAGRFVTLNGQPTVEVGDTRTVTDQSATNGMRFYRVRLTGP